MPRAQVINAACYNKTMYTDPYNPELDPSKNPELAGENTNEIATGWEDVAAEADSPDAPPVIGSPESYASPERAHQGTISEDLNALRSHIDNIDDEDSGSLERLKESTDTDSLDEKATDEAANEATKELDEAEVEARLREYVMSLESEFNGVRNMNNDGLRRKIRDEKHSLEQRLSSPDASSDRTLRIDLAVRKRAEAIFRERDFEK